MGSEMCIRDSPYTDDIDVKGTVFSLLWGAQAGASPVVPAIYPRTSFDYFVIDGLSLGGSVGFSTASVKVKSGGSSMEGDHTAVTFAPRVGYAFGLSDTIWFWLRGGPTYVCLLYTSDAADDLLCVDLGGRRFIKKKTHYHYFQS